jgi:hypothetical protein
MGRFVRYMIEAVERLFVIALFGVMALWLAMDVRRNLKTGAVPSQRWWQVSPAATREQRPLDYWVTIGLKMAGVFAAAMMAAWYFFLSVTN